MNDTNKPLIALDSIRLCNPDRDRKILYIYYKMCDISVTELIYEKKEDFEYDYEQIMIHMDKFENS
jgi:hypothetical protein